MPYTAPEMFRMAKYTFLHFERIHQTSQLAQGISTANMFTLDTDTTTNKRTANGVTRYNIQYTKVENIHSEICEN